MRISDWSSDVCSSDLAGRTHPDRRLNLVVAVPVVASVAIVAVAIVIIVDEIADGRAHGGTRGGALTDGNVIGHSADTSTHGGPDSCALDQAVVRASGERPRHGGGGDTPPLPDSALLDRKHVVLGNGWAVLVDLGGRRI